MKRIVGFIAGILLVESALASAPLIECRPEVVRGKSVVRVYGRNADDYRLLQSIAYGREIERDMALDICNEEKEKWYIGACRNWNPLLNVSIVPCAYNRATDEHAPIGFFLTKSFSEQIDYIGKRIKEELSEYTIIVHDISIE